MSDRQRSADVKRAAGTLDVQSEWKNARKSKALKTVLGTLREMAGTRERCMYCGDSHGTDIDRFWPKAPYPERLFVWTNLLLGCTECGRFKGERLPLQSGIPQLIDPTAEDPWEHLDFDPATGNIVARFDPAANNWMSKGTETVRLLQLDRREALAAGYQKTHLRIKSIIAQTLQGPVPQAETLIQALRAADDHGLSGWCFRGAGANESPFREFRAQHPGTWAVCETSLA
ncbi:MAG: hypothetical protein P4L83_01915 [Nevskia sp.]|nr:hypothetical protein [Nevskia sp.]